MDGLVGADEADGGYDLPGIVRWLIRGLTYVVLDLMYYTSAITCF